MSGGETLFQGPLALLLPAPRCLGQLPWKASMGSARRCLFGRPDHTPVPPDDQRERFIQRWDFDIVEEKPVYPPKRFLWEKVPCAASTDSRNRHRYTPYKQLRITDFWRSRKFDDPSKKKEQSSTVNSE